MSGRPPNWVTFFGAHDAARARRRVPLNRNQRQAIYARDGVQCRKCGTSRNPSIDHIVPVARGGTNDPSNLQVLCRSCNSRKGARV